jgi:hypothetical protein
MQVVAAAKEWISSTLDVIHGWPETKPWLDANDTAQLQTQVGAVLMKAGKPLAAGSRQLLFSAQSEANEYDNHCCLE